MSGPKVARKVDATVMARMRKSHAVSFTTISRVTIKIMCGVSPWGSKELLGSYERRTCGRSSVDAQTGSVQTYYIAVKSGRG